MKNSDHRERIAGKPPQRHLNINAVCTAERGTRRQFRLMKELIADLKPEVARIIHRERELHQKRERAPGRDLRADLGQIFLGADNLAR